MAIEVTHIYHDSKNVQHSYLAGLFMDYDLKHLVDNPETLEEEGINSAVILENHVVQVSGWTFENGLFTRLYE